jgi:hypothetical protein
MFKERVYEPISKLGPDGVHAPKVVFDLQAGSNLGIDVDGVKGLMRLGRIGSINVTGLQTRFGIPENEFGITLDTISPVRGSRLYHIDFPPQGKRIHIDMEFSLLNMADRIEKRGDNPDSDTALAGEIDLFLKREIASNGAHNLVGRAEEKTKFAVFTSMGAGLPALMELAQEIILDAPPSTAAPILMTMGILAGHSVAKGLDRQMYRRHKRPEDEGFAWSLFSGSQPDRTLWLRQKAQSQRPLVRALVA